MDHPTDLAARAKAALERVCSGAELDSASRYYSPTFVDHVNDLEFHGLAGARASVGMYQRVLVDLAIEVTEQIVVGDRVTSRFVVTGANRGRRVRFGGITISRFAGGLIVEDWSVVDTLALVRQLGAWRAVVAGARYLWGRR
jgi:predicted ester cyclase